MLIALEVTDRLQNFDLYVESWREVSVVGKTEHKKWIPTNEWKEEREIELMVELEVRKISTITRFPLESFRPVLKFAVTQIRLKINRGHEISIQKLLNGFFFLLIWKSAAEIVDAQNLSFDVYMKPFL